MAIYSPDEQPGFSPSSEQLEREQQLKRFNRLYIYLPVGIVLFIAAGLIVLMLVGIFAPGLVGAEEFLSGLADTILVLWMLPMTVLCALGPVAYLGYLVNRRQRRSELPADSPLLQHSRTQMALWKAENIVDRVEQTAESSSDKIVQPIFEANVRAAGLRSWVDQVTGIFWRDNGNERNGSTGPDGSGGG
ncbi:MAG: hypothetical protein ACK2UK_07040 [Candidatus Promineifilaceae bacterium]